jgi:hypothetical protein
MNTKRIASIAASVCAAVFVITMAWGLVLGSRLGGNQVCVQDAGSAQLFGVPGPGAYMFDRDSNRPVRIAAPRAFAMTLGGVVHAAYPGQAKCGAKALVQTANGVIAVASLLCTIVALVAGFFARPGGSAARAASIAT